MICNFVRKASRVMLEFCFIKRWPLSKARLWWFLRNEGHAELLAMVLLVMWSLTLLFSFSPGLYILDVDKCSDGSHDCHPNATCWGDTAGNFTCTCQAGFTGNGRQCYGKLIRKCTYLTNSFHVAVRLFSNRSQMTSNVVKKKKWHTSRRQVRMCHRCFYHILTSSVIYYWTNPRQHGIYLFYTMISTEKRPIQIPASHRLTVWAFVLV